MTVRTSFDNRARRRRSRGYTVTRRPSDGPVSNDAYESQERFIRDLTERRRRELFDLLIATGQNPRSPQIVAWVKRRIELKSGNRLRGYASCIYSIEQGQSRVRSGHVAAK